MRPRIAARMPSALMPLSVASRHARKVMPMIGPCLKPNLRSSRAFMVHYSSVLLRRDSIQRFGVFPPSVQRGGHGDRAFALNDSWGTAMGAPWL